MTAPFLGHETWQAIHADCDTGCGGCVPLDLDLDVPRLTQIRAVARLLGTTPEAFIHFAVCAGMRAEVGA